MRRLLPLIGIILLSACAQSSLLHPLPTEPSATPTVSSRNESYSGGLRTLFVSEPGQLRGMENKAPYFQVNPGDSLRGQVGLVNEFPDTKQVLFFLMLNYAQSDFAVEGGEFASSYRATLKPGAELSLQVRTRTLLEGYYDIAWVFVIDPDNLQVDTRSRARTEWTPLNRSHAFVGSASPPVLNLKPFDNLILNPSSGYSHLFSLEASAESFDLWSEVIVKPGAWLNFFVRFGVPSSQVLNGQDQVPIALIGFLDYRQVKLNDQDVIYGLAKNGYITTIPLRLQAPRTPGTYQFFVHRFPNPYTPVGLSTVPFNSLSTQRIVIYVTTR